MIAELSISTTTSLVLQIVMVASLLVLCWQDVRERQVSLLLLLLLIGACLLRFFISREPVNYVLLNALFLTTQTGVIFLYLFIRYRTFKVSNYLGAGDIVFWLACLWCFSPLNFLMFFVCSLLGALLLHLLLRKLLKDYQVVFIPLAGFQSFFLVLALLLEKVVPGWSTYNDLPLLSTFGLY